MSVKFLHLRIPGKPGGCTVAYSIDEENGLAYYAVAQCNPKDNYCKRTGRVKSQGRLDSDRYVKQVQYTNRETLVKHLIHLYHPEPTAIVLTDLKDRSFGRGAVSEHFSY